MGRSAAGLFLCPKTTIGCSNVSQSWCPTCRKWLAEGEALLHKSGNELHVAVPWNSIEANASVNVRVEQSDTWIKQDYPVDATGYQFLTPGIYVIATDAENGELLARIRVEETSDLMTARALASEIQHTIELFYLTRKPLPEGSPDVEVRRSGENATRILNTRWYDPALGFDFRQPAIDIRIVYNREEQHVGQIKYELEGRVQQLVRALAEASAGGLPEHGELPG